MSKILEILKQGKIRKIALVCFLFILGWISNQVYLKYILKIGEKDMPIRQNSSDFRYINPLLFVDNSEEIFPEYRNLKEDISDYINRNIKDDKVEKASLYFRDLNSSHWAGVNEKELYTPSSMLKVAVLLTYLKISEKNPDIMSKKVKYIHKDSYNEYYKTNKIKNGEYTVLELLQYMIIESDNTSMSLLVALNTPEVVELYEDLKLPNILEGSSDFLSAEDYSYIFRTLYNASYVNKGLSEQALQLLTYTKFDKGIVAGVEASTTVAHKFGEHTITFNGVVTERQLHDCGIVYYPKKPYLVCIMTKGKDFKNLEKIISDISSIVFNYNKNTN